MMNFSYRSISYASIVTIVVVTIVSLVGEVSKPFMNLLSVLTSHHWITKNILSVIVFVVSLGLFSREAEPNPGPDAKMLLWVGASAVVCSCALLAFFVIDFLKG
jgi:hypothetical protein